jgi:hypothetical protein
MIKMILILPNIILIINTNPLKHPSPSNPLKPNPIHTKILNTNLFNIRDSFFVYVYNYKRGFYLSVEIWVENFEIEPLIETDCICVVGENEEIFFWDCSSWDFEGCG